MGVELLVDSRVVTETPITFTLALSVGLAIDDRVTLLFRGRVENTLHVAITTNVAGGDTGIGKGAGI